MLVCSLGLQPDGVTMPWGLLKGDGVAYIDILEVIDTLSSPYIEIRFTYDAKVGTYDGLFGGWRSDTINTGIWVNDGHIHTRWGKNMGTTYYNAPCSPSTTQHVIIADMSKFKYDSTVLYSTGISPITYANTNLLFATDRQQGAGNISKCSVAYFILNDGNTKYKRFIPFKTGKAWAAEDVSTGVAQAAGTCGMIDLVSGKLFPNANSSGSFTINYSIHQNGQWVPWTPGT